MNNPDTPATQCPHCGNWIYTRLYYRQHVQECVNRTPAMKDLSDGALEVLPAVAPLRACRDCDSPFSPRKATHVLCDVCVWSALEMAWSLVEPDFFGDVSEFTESHDPYQQASTPPNYIKDSPLMEIIEQSDTE